MRVVLCTRIEKFDDEISKLEELEIIGKMNDSNDIEYDLKELAKKTPDVMIINRYLFETSIDLVKLIKEIRITNALQRFIVITGKYEKDFVQPLVNIGVYDFIIEDFSLSNVKHIIDNPSVEFDFSIYENKLKKTGDKETKSIDITLPFTKKVLIKSIFKEAIVFYSPSTATEELGLNYAKYLAKKNNCKVLFLDYNFMKPIDISGKSSTRDLSFLIENYENTGKVIDNIEICKMVIDKVDVLTSNFNFHDYYHYDDEILGSLINKLKTYYDYVIINVNQYLIDNATFSALNFSDKIYLVSTADSKSDLELTNRYIKLIAERIEANIEGVIISDYLATSLTSVEVEAYLSRNVKAYMDKKRLLKKNYDREYKKIGG